MLEAAIAAGVRVFVAEKGSDNVKDTEIRIPEAVAAAMAAAAVPPPTPIGQVPGMTNIPLGAPGPSGVGVNFPGTSWGNVGYAPGAQPAAPAVDPVPASPATAPGGSPALRAILPAVGGIATAGMVVLSAGMIFASDTKIHQIDFSQTNRLIDKVVKIVEEESARLNKETFDGNWTTVAACNPELFKRIAELANSNDPWTGFKLLKIAFGRTVEEMVANRIVVDPELDDAIDREGGANKPDFRGNPLSPLRDFTFDVTTFDDLKRHMARKENPAYGRYLIGIGYERWFKDSLK